MHQGAMTESNERGQLEFDSSRRAREEEEEVEKKMKKKGREKISSLSST